MRLVPPPSQAESPLRHFVGAPLVILFADAEELQPSRQRGGGTIEVSAGVSLSDDDTYLIVPDDVGDELVDILRDADRELLEETLDESLLVLGDLHRGAEGRTVVAADFAMSVTEAFRQGLPYAAQVPVDGQGGGLRSLNQLAHVQCTMVSALMDTDGWRSVLRQSNYIGVSWRSPADTPSLASLSPTFVVSNRSGDGHIGLDLALFVEDDDLVALVRPAELLTTAAA